MVILMQVSSWYRHRLLELVQAKGAAIRAALPTGRVRLALLVLVLLVFSKNVYLASLTSFYTFYLIDKFHLTVQSAQLHLFVLLGAVAAGTFIGGPVGDRIGRKYVIWVSILGALPFTLLLPYANLFWTEVLTVIIGLILASAFSAIVVFAQELVPGPRRHRAGRVLRLCLRRRRPRRGDARAARRRDEHRHRLQGLLVPAGDRAADLVPSQHRAGAARAPLTLARPTHIL